MNDLDNFEHQLRSSLKRGDEKLTEQDLRRTSLPSARRTRSAAPVIGSAALVAAAVIGIAVGIHASVSQPQAATETTSAAASRQSQGATMRPSEPVATTTSDYASPTFAGDATNCGRQIPAPSSDISATLTPAPNHEAGAVLNIRNKTGEPIMFSKFDVTVVVLDMSGKIKGFRSDLAPNQPAGGEPVTLDPSEQWAQTVLVTNTEQDCDSTQSGTDYQRISKLPAGNYQFAILFASKSGDPRYAIVSKPQEGQLDSAGQILVSS